MVILIMGVSGSGKSTIGHRLADDLGWQFADADDFHPPRNREKLHRGVPLTEADRRPWLNTLRALIRRWLREDQPAVLACSALKASYRRRLLVDPARMRLVYLRGTFRVIQSRLKRRKHHFMPAGLLKSQFATLQEPTHAIIVDVTAPPRTILRRIRAELKL